MGRVTRSEAEVRRDLIDPKLEQAGWVDELVDREYLYFRGRVRLIGEDTVQDVPQYADYVLRDRPDGLPLAVLEAKDEDHSPGAGLQQAIAYATDIGALFALSSNGQGIVQQNLSTHEVTNLDVFPSPEELRDLTQSQRPLRASTVTASNGEEVANPLLEPAASAPGGGGGLRYYQEAAVTAAIEQAIAGKRRALLSLATGTGKTFIACNVAWKMTRTGWAKKVLFLADRVSLRDQAFNEFGVFGDARGVISSDALPLQRDIHFGIYQTLYASTEEGRLYQNYDPEYFDLIIVDECHRSGYGDWAQILEHFGSAFHLGLTATPKRSDSIDTYEFFASENRDAEGNPQPAYEYSLGRGIDDGFLATYRVYRIQSSLDRTGLHIEDEVSRGADLLVPEGATVDDVYQMTQYEREIVIPDRTRTLCEHLAERMLSLGINDKTIIFCVNMEHADLVRQEMQRLLGPLASKQLYAARIVSEERDAQTMLEEFQSSQSSQPVIATTVDLLSTGVNVPSLRNIVFMKPVGSPSLFKQIIGRGSRIDPVTEKSFFRIIDYTNASRLFDDWDLPSEPPDDGATEEVLELTGRVVSAVTSEPIEGAAVVVRRGLRTIAEVTTGEDGVFAVQDIHATEVLALVSAPTYSRTQRACSLEGQDGVVEIALHPISEAAGKIRISGVEVRIVDETVLTLESGGTELTVAEYLDHAGEAIRSRAGDRVTLAELWRDPATRRRLREDLREGNVDGQVLALLTRRPDADEFDLLANAAYSDRIRTREERARRVERAEQSLSRYGEIQARVLRDLLDKYRLSGVDELASADVFEIPPFDSFGGTRGIVGIFGGVEPLKAALADLQAMLYSEDPAA